MRLLTVLILILANQSAWSAFSNYNSILLGDQVAGMAGAGTAIVGDVAASPFYNPATMGFLENTAFSAAVGVYKKFDTLYGEEEDFTKAPLRVNQGFFRSLPSSVGSAIKYDDWMLALSIVVPDYDNFKGDLYNKQQNVTTLSYVDESLWVGGAIAKKISETEALGFTLYYTARNFTRSLSDRSFPSANEAMIFTSERTKTDNTIVAVFGYFRQINEHWSTGLSVRPRSVKVASQVNVFESNVYVNTATNVLTEDTINEPDRGGDAIIPSRISWGLVYRPNEDWIFSGDLTYHEGLSYEDGDFHAISTEVNHRSTWNIQVGLENRFYSWLKLRTGFFTDFSSHPDPASTSRYQLDHVDKLGYSANFAVVKDKIEYTFGGYYTNGRGISRQRINQRYETISKTQHTFTMLVGTSYYF